MADWTIFAFLKFMTGRWRDEIVVVSSSAGKIYLLLVGMRFRGTQYTSVNKPYLPLEPPGLYWVELKMFISIVKMLQNLFSVMVSPEYKFENRLPMVSFFRANHFGPMTSPVQSCWSQQCQSSFRSLLVSTHRTRQFFGFRIGRLSLSTFMERSKKPWQL